ncbi:EAL domain-containing protein [Altererythrobacter endophyticus]|uniref:EAL domain-containing protein n=2 Tax=Altericroceibacterium endophyticum TaxID=1808508 RepID=A0A6I4T4P8_9SPHN|nr:EAL domain-containing protein [Altericroceibacterium endophyticum]
MKQPGSRSGCQGCEHSTALPFDFTMAFQPIVQLSSKSIWGYEALIRGVSGEGAAAILDRVEPDMIYSFDQACRVRAIEQAAALFPDDGSKLSINFKPNAVYEPLACIQATLKAANQFGFDRQRLMFEFTEDERMHDVPHLMRIIEAYRSFGFTTAIDDFGAGHAGLSLLADFQPDLIKFDMALMRGIDTSPARRTIVAAMVSVARDLGITCLAEGMETAEEVAVMRDLGVDLMQGYFFARPATGALAETHNL